jgi:hypothetical protein
MRSYSCQFTDKENRFVSGPGGSYKSETPEAAARMLLTEHGAISTIVQVTWGLTGYSKIDFSKSSEAEQKEEQSQRHKTLRQSFSNLINEISKIPDNADYLDLTHDLRKSLRAFENTITTIPLDDWSEDEKSIFRFWRKLKRYGLEDNETGERSRTERLTTQKTGAANYEKSGWIVFLEILGVLNILVGLLLGVLGFQASQGAGFNLIIAGVSCFFAAFLVDVFTRIQRNTALTAEHLNRIHEASCSRPSPSFSPKGIVQRRQVV